MGAPPDATRTMRSYSFLPLHVQKESPPIPRAGKP